MFVAIAFLFSVPMSAEAAVYVSPSSGTAPLSITATFELPSACSSYVLNWGDGSNDSYVHPIIAANCMPASTQMTKSHIYQNAGEYTVQLTHGSNTSSTLVKVSSKDEDVSSIQLTANPTSGNAPLNVTFSHNVPGNAVGPLTMHFGDGTTRQVDACPLSPNDICTTPATLSYIYSKNGTHTARLTGGEVEYGRVTIKVNNVTEQTRNNTEQTRNNTDSSEENSEESKIRNQLIKLIETLLLQVQSRGSSISLPVGNSVGNSDACVDLTRPLYVGASDTTTNGEVTRLQNFLRQTGDFTYPEITGFYGQSTQQAVQNWQIRNHIVTSGTPATTGLGLVGALTRAAMSCR